MDFSSTEEQELLHKSLREFAEEELEPKYLERAKKDRIDLEVVKKLHSMGLTESCSGTDAADIKSIAVRDGDVYGESPHQITWNNTKEVG